jgi:hypothetical protein
MLLTLLLLLATCCWPQAPIMLGKPLADQTVESQASCHPWDKPTQPPGQTDTPLQKNLSKQQ